MDNNHKSLASSVRTAIISKLPSYFRPVNVAERFLQKKLASKKVLGGPFRGMLYISESVGSVLVPKQLGCYEVELQSSIGKYLFAKPCVFIDVGAAEGYYAVGLASKCRASRVIAFEASEAGRKTLSQLANLNGVADRVEINGFCSAETFERAVVTSCPDLVIMDIEGGERELLSERVVPLLGKADLIVELHPWICPTIESDLKNRFAKTHMIDVVATRPRKSNDLPFGSFFNTLFARWFVPKLNELRPEPMRWLIMTPLISRFPDE